MKDMKCSYCGETVQIEDDDRSNICDDCNKPVYNKKCDNCGDSPVHKITGMCGPCTFGDSTTSGGNW